MSAESATAYFVDASIYVFQAHFSPRVQCVGEDGNDLSALFGFSQFLLHFLRREQPLRVAVAFDESLFCGFRHQLCGAYKSNRELPDPNLEQQLKACAELCGILGLAAFGSRRYEADDIIGTLLRRVREAPGKDSGELVIVSRDKDLAQLVRSGREVMWDFQKNSRRAAADIRREFGVLPCQIPDYLGMVGDAVDRIHGIPGIGPVKARALLAEFASLDGVYANLPLIAGLPLRGAAGLADLLAAHRDLAYLSRRLATIIDDVEDHEEHFSVVPLENLARRPVALDRLEDFFRTYGFTPGFSSSMVASAARLNDAAKI